MAPRLEYSSVTSPFSRVRTANSPPSATKLRTCGAIFDAPSLRAQLTEIETKLSDPGVWSDQERSQQLMRPRKRLEASLAMDAELARRADDIAAYFDLAREGEAVTEDLRKEIDCLREIAEKLEIQLLLPGENDARNAIVTIHPGAGGTESQDWAEMLLRLYLRWAERQGFQVEMNEYQSAEEASIKSATFSVIGDYAYGLLTSEIGVHRLVRISPLDQHSRRHSSLANVFVL